VQVIEAWPLAHATVSTPAAPACPHVRAQGDCSLQSDMPLPVSEAPRPTLDLSGVSSSSDNSSEVRSLLMGKSLHILISRRALRKSVISTCGSAQQLTSSSNANILSSHCGGCSNADQPVAHLLSCSNVEHFFFSSGLHAQLHSPLTQTGIKIIIIIIINMLPCRS
jgi:hypothetical protein